MAVPRPFRKARIIAVLHDSHNTLASLAPSSTAEWCPSASCAGRKNIGSRHSGSRFDSAFLSDSLIGQTSIPGYSQLCLTLQPVTECYLWHHFD